MAGFAKEIVLDTSTGKMTVDGVEFPWHFGEDWSVTGGPIPVLNLAIFADRVIVTEGQGPRVEG